MPVYRCLQHCRLSMHYHSVHFLRGLHWLHSCQAPAGRTVPGSKFSLRRFGNIVNTVAIAFLVLAFVFLLFPAAPNPTPTTMNRAILIYGVAVIFATGYYIMKGRHEYEVPVHYVRWQTRQDLE